MLGFLRLVIPGLQAPSDPYTTAEALRQEVVREQLLNSALPQSEDSQPADGSVTETSSPSQSSLE